MTYDHDALVTRVEQGFNLYWMRANPELFAKAVMDALEKYPFDQWDFAVKPAYMPGEKYMLLITRRDNDA